MCGGDICSVFGLIPSESFSPKWQRLCSVGLVAVRQMGMVRGRTRSQHSQPARFGRRNVNDRVQAEKRVRATSIALEEAGEEREEELETAQVGACRTSAEDCLNLVDTRVLFIVHAAEHTQ